MASIRIIAHAQLATRDQIVNTKSTNVIQDHVKMAAHAPITTMIIHAIVLMDSPEKIVRNMLIGVHKIHVKMEHLVHNVKIPINVTVYRAGLENYVTLKWYHAKMLQSERESMLRNYVIMELAKTLEIHTNAIAIWDTLDRTVRRRSTNANHSHVKMVALAKI